MRISRVLKFADTECRFGFISDLSESKAGVRKPRKKKVITPVDAVTAV